MDISALAVLWNDTKAHYDTQRAQFAELSAREKAIRHCESYMLAIPAPTQRDVESDINKIAANFRQAMIRDAERAFAPAGGKLVIDESELNRILGSDRYCDNFDPVKFWNVLQDRYGGAKGEETAHRQIARTLSSQFSLEHKSEVKIVGGCVVLEKHIWVDDFDKKHYKVNKMSYSCAESIQSTMQALAHFAAWANEPDLAAELRKHPWGHDRVIESRQRISFGRARLDVITYASRFEFRFAQSLAEQLMIFMGTYGPAVLAEA